LASAVVLVALCFTAHHATPILFLPPMLIASVLVVLPAGERRVRISRAILVATASFAVGGLAVLPLWMWARDAPLQAAIPHLSRESLLQDFDAQVLFFWAMYGTLPALAVAGLRWSDLRTRACGLLALGFGVLGLGGTTPVPALLFGPFWQVLTYDRFALWAAVAALPLAGIAIDRAFAARSVAGRSLAAFALLSLAGVAALAAVLPTAELVRKEHDLRPIADYLNVADRATWRYQTFGLGETSVRLGYLTRATTIDGTYFTARRVPELARSGIGMLDSALWWDPSGATLRRALAAADRYSIRWAFVADPAYDPYLIESGFARIGALGGGVAVWEKPDVTPVSADALRFGEPDTLGILWGTVPFALLLGAIGLGLAHLRRRSAPTGRTIDQWTAPRGALERSPSL